MPLIVPIERTTVMRSQLFSSYRDISDDINKFLSIPVVSKYFILQTLKNGKQSNDIRRPLFRIITSGEHPFYIVAYGSKLNEIVNNEWRYLNEIVIPSVMQTSDNNTMKNNIVIYITKLCKTYNTIELSVKYISNSDEPILGPIDSTVEQLDNSNKKLQVNKYNNDKLISDPNVTIYTHLHDDYNIDTNDRSIQTSPIEQQRQIPKTLKKVLNNTNDDTIQDYEKDTTSPTINISKTLNTNKSIRKNSLFQSWIPIQVYPEPIQEPIVNTKQLLYTNNSGFSPLVLQQYNPNFNNSNNNTSDNTSDLFTDKNFIMNENMGNSELDKTLNELPIPNCTQYVSLLKFLLLQEILPVGIYILCKYTDTHFHYMQYSIWAVSIFVQLQQIRVKSVLYIEVYDNIITTSSYLRNICIYLKSQINTTTTANNNKYKYKKNKQKTISNTNLSDINLSDCDDITSTLSGSFSSDDSNCNTIYEYNKDCISQDTITNKSIINEENMIENTSSIHLNDDEKQQILQLRYPLQKEYLETLKITKRNLSLYCNINPQRLTSLPKTCYSPLQGTEFDVRQMNYKQTKKKGPSESSLMEFVLLDCFRSTAKIDHITSFTDLPLPCDQQKKFDELELDEPIPLEQLKEVQNLIEPNDILSFPSYLVINMMFPNYSPSLMNSTVDGNGFMLVFYYVLYGEQRRKVINMLQNNDRSAILLDNFGKSNLLSTKHSLKGRLKGIPKVLNIKDFDMGMMINNILAKYNATPFLTGPIHQRWYSGVNYLESDVDIHEYCYMARKVAYATMGYFPMMKIQMGFVIEARDDKELPERIIGSNQVNFVDIYSSPSITSLHPINRSICVDGIKILNQYIGFKSNNNGQQNKDLIDGSTKIEALDEIQNSS